MIVQALSEIQSRCGYLPQEELRALAGRLRVPLYRIQEVASFFPHYRMQPPPRVEVRVCRDMVCHLRGSMELRRRLELAAREIDPSQVVVEGVSCLGQCDAAPSAVSINDHVYRGCAEGELVSLTRSAAVGQPVPAQPVERGPCGWHIDPYAGQPRYEALRRFLQTRNANGLLRALEIANLRGLGGAGFPTARKWAAVREAPGDVKYVICNADESEPGTFKDRELLRRTPHLVLEGMILAGLVTGASRGYIYIRHEYHDELDALREAITHAERDRLCGEDILGTGLSLPIEVFVSPGGYIQGEETALLEAMEDRRGEPRNKPPFPVTHGLFNRPTVINNVETLAWVPAIALRGGEWYRDQGVRGATGLRFVSISGDVQKPGVYEVPFGQTVRELIFDTAGGMASGAASACRDSDSQEHKAIAPSGPSGGFLPAFIPTDRLPETFKARLPAGAPGLDILDLTLDFKTLADLGSMLGAAFVVYGNRANMLEQALNCTEFFRNESCGKCVPCRLGSQKLVEIIQDVLGRRGDSESLAVVPELAQTMNVTSICGLGQVAANPIASVLKYFPEDIAV